MGFSLSDLDPWEAAKDWADDPVGQTVKGFTNAADYAMFGGFGEELGQAAGILPPDMPGAPDFASIEERQAYEQNLMIQQANMMNRPNINTPYQQTQWSYQPYQQQQPTQAPSGDEARNPAFGEMWSPEGTQAADSGPTPWMAEQAAAGQPGAWQQDITLNPEDQKTLDASRQMTRQNQFMSGGMLGNLSDTFGRDPYTADEGVQDWAGGFMDRTTTPEQGDTSAQMRQLEQWGEMLPEGHPGRADLLQQWQALKLQGAGSTQGQAPDASQFERSQFNAQPVQNQFDTSNVSGLTDAYQLGKEQEDAIYNRGASRLDPYWEGKQSDKDIQLRNQGLRPGDEAYDRAMKNTTDARTDAYQALQNEATMGRSAEANIFGGMELDRRAQTRGEAETSGQFFNEAGQQRYGQEFEIGQERFDQDFDIRREEFGQGMELAGQQDFQRDQRFQESLMSNDDYRAAAASNDTSRMNQIIEELQGHQQAMSDYGSFYDRGFQQPQITGSAPNPTAQVGTTPNYLGAAQLGYQDDQMRANVKSATNQNLFNTALTAGAAFLNPMAGVAAVAGGGNNAPDPYDSYDI